MDDCYTLVINHLPLAYTQEIADQILRPIFLFYQEKYDLPRHWFPGQRHCLGKIRFFQRPDGCANGLPDRQKIINFQQMGFFKILFAADDTTILKSYEQQPLDLWKSMTGIHHSSIWKRCVLILKMTVV